ncbi:pentapeptide repeat-containing protein [Methanosarcina siciliae]|nr:pentapeptide repeat-containing protein [Methanosarcina siciliae]
MVLREELKQFLGNAKKEMKQLYEKIKQHPLTCLICIIAIVTAVVLLIALPYWRVAQFGITNPKDLADAENSYRSTLAQILGGIAVGIGIYFAWGNLTNSREGQITDRFTRAIEQLGSKELEIRLGGIYALERIANESEKDYWPIVEILTAYIRKNSPVELAESRDKITLDIQAILTVIGKTKNNFNNENSKRLDLRGTFLQGANLQETNLQGANLQEANLQGVDLQEANLQGADFSEANLQGADLRDSHLEGADLCSAHIEEAYLYDTHLEKAVLLDVHLERAGLNDAYLEKASFNGAHLEKAEFWGANLKGAEFWGANLEGTLLREANLEGANLIEANLERANLIEANLERAILMYANLKGANFEGVNLEEANFEGTNLKRTKNLTVDQLSKVKTLYKAELDPELEKPLKEKYPTLFEKPKDKPLFSDEI